MHGLMRGGWQTVIGLSFQSVASCLLYLVPELVPETLVPTLVPPCEIYLSKAGVERRENYLKTAKGRRILRIMLSDGLQPLAN